MFGVFALRSAAVVGKRRSEREHLVDVAGQVVGHLAEITAALDVMLAGRGRRIDAVIELQVDEEQLVDRLHTRIAQTQAAGQPARADDNEETLRNRLKVFREQTAPIIPYYRDKGLLRTIDGMRSIDDVAAAIDGVIGAANAARAAG